MLLEGRTGTKEVTRAERGITNRCARRETSVRLIALVWPILHNLMDTLPGYAKHLANAPVRPVFFLAQSAYLGVAVVHCFGSRLPSRISHVHILYEFLDIVKYLV